MALRRFEHGGNVYAHAGCVDFSASLNPLGMPQSVREALCDGVDAFGCYPDPACTELVRALAAFEQVPCEWVLACAGATDAFARVCAALRPPHALVCAPCYSGYEQALEQVGSEVVCHTLSAERGFVLEDVPVAHSGASVVFVANPNNPTGLCVERDVLVRCLDRAREAGALVVLDECFVDLTQHAGSNDLLARYPNLVIVKAFTKTFALAGLRLGYALCSDAELLERLRAAGQPWAVSVPAQIAGVACADQGDYLARSRRLVAHERERLSQALASHGLAVVPSDANYLLFCGPRGLDQKLLARGILVRTCDNFRGLDNTWYRVAVRLPAQNAKLVDALGEVLR